MVGQHCQLGYTNNTYDKMLLHVACSQLDMYLVSVIQVTVNSDNVAM